MPYARIFNCNSFTFSQNIHKIIDNVNHIKKIIIVYISDLIIQK